MKDLNRHIIEQYAVNWESLGLELGLENYHIDNIFSNNSHNVIACCRQMLSKWLEIDTSATWGKLDDAINIRLPSPTTHTGTLYNVSISKILCGLEFGR